MRPTGEEIPRQQPRGAVSRAGSQMDAGALGPHAGLFFLLGFVATFRGALLAVMASFVASSLAISVLPVLVGRLVQAAAREGVSAGVVYWYALLLIGVNLIHDLFWRGGEVLYRRLLVHRGYECEDVLFGRVIGQPYPYFVGKFTGKISSFVATIGREFRDTLDAACFTYVELVVRIPATVFIMFAVNVWSGLTFLGAVLLMLVVGRRTARRAFRAEKELADETSELDGHVIDIIANFVSVKSFHQERAEYAEVHRRRRRVIDAARRSSLWDIVFWASMAVIVRYLVWPLSILLNLYLYRSGQLSLAEFATFLSVLVMFSDFIWMMVWEIAQLNLRLARVEEAYHYLFGADPVQAAIAVGPESPASGRQVDAGSSVVGGQVELRGLAFAYPDSPTRSVLSDITLAIAAGEKIGVVGRSGSGKTTLVKLLLGYYPLPAGTVLVSGRPVSNDRLAAAISYVPQDTALFHRSIRDNITYGASVAVPEQEVQTAATRAHAHGFITQAPQGYDTLVGERGIRLSTGQRQRIAIARAFLDDKPILILDEATSALDSESEVLVQHALEQLWAGKTVIAVAHRLSTLRNMDRIIVLADGEIVEQGTHTELLAAGGRYQALWERQSGGMLPVD
ncbi:ABC transporter ATP-binding protein/permease [Frankia sp. AgPm24]|uniref:ABC transporter ATP-binding protein n=1 Tax=Frankia sp. AgPm24 TaxID=631128 RepID=UPI00200F34A3|nr:ABC transporter ATP-binding protein [Frankia sp. AgPm24]MCK9921066.1 ABC transporter ATP-binding protein/permease [Frankia sp. AgPm24]